MSEIKIWNKTNLKEKNNYRFFPTDMMLRALFANQYFNSENLRENGLVLDVGCLFANNLLPFFERGWKCFGTEVTEEAINIAKNCCIKQQIKAQIKFGLNTNLPFQNDYFDILLSIATIHYEDTITGVENSLKEFCRVLKPGGCALIQTVAPGHTMFKNSKHLSKNLYQLKMKNDLRHKQLFTFFKNKEELENLAYRHFTNVETARCTETYPNSCIDVWLLKLIK